MKKIQLLSLASLLLGFYACDKIEAPYRPHASVGVTYINADSVVVSGDTFGFLPDNSTAVKRVLTEDYTGHLCGNCPDAGHLLNDTLKPLYGDRLVVVSVHAGWFALPCPSSGPSPCIVTPDPTAFAADFRSDVGNDWDTKFGNSNAGMPNGMIDRMDYDLNGDHIKNWSQWKSFIEDRLPLDPGFRIRGMAKYSAGSRTVKVAVRTDAVTATSTDYNLAVVLTEDSIVDWQKWDIINPPYQSNYLHRHMLRKAVTDSFGETIFSGTQTAGTSALRAYSLVLPSSYVAKNCHLVAFVFNKNTYEIRNAIDIPVEE